MDDKKRDDYAIQMPDIEMRNRDDAEKDPFLPTRSASGSTGGMKKGLPSSITNSPGLSVLAYCLSSISMTIVNKYCVSGTFWNLSFFLLLVQSLVCVVAIQVCKSMGLITNLAAFEVEKAKKWFPVSMLLVGMIYTSMKALQYLSVPVYTIFKNLTIIVIAYGEVLWFGGAVSQSALFSFGLMVLSSIIAAWADIQHVLASYGTTTVGSAADDASAAAALSVLNAGYAWMGLNVFFTSAYLLMMKKFIKTVNFKDWDTMFYNNLLTIPILMVFSLLIEDWSSANVAKNFPIESRNNIVIAMVYSGVCTIFISYCSAWCIRVTSSTTYSMVGALNKLPIAVSGLIFFDAAVTFGSVSAIFLGFVSGIVYTWSKIKSSQRNNMSLPTTTMSASSQSSRDANSS